VSKYINKRVNKSRLDGLDWIQLAQQRQLNSFWENIIITYSAQFEFSGKVFVCITVHYYVSLEDIIRVVIGFVGETRMVVVLPFSLVHRMQSSTGFSNTIT